LDLNTLKREKQRDQMDKQKDISNINLSYMGT